MPLNKTFIRAPKEVPEDEFVRIVSVSAVVENITQVRFSLNTNLPNTSLNLRLDGAQNSDFINSPDVNANFTTDSQGLATIRYYLDPDSTVTRDFNGTVVSDNGLDLQTSGNVLINVDPTITASGGTETTYNAGTFNEYKVHSFTSNGSLNVSAVGPGGTVYEQAVGGGGAGGRSFRWQQILFGAFNNWYQFTGGGGGAGEVVVSNVNVNTYSVTNYPVTVGVGGVGSSTSDTPTSATASTYKSLTADPGGYGGSSNALPQQNVVNGGGGGGVFQDWDDHAVHWESNGYAPNPPITPRPSYNSSYAYHIAVDSSMISGASSPLWGDPSFGWNWDNVYYPDPDKYNQAGVRPNCAGSIGSSHSGSNAVIISGDVTQFDFGSGLEVINFRSMATGGAGASATASATTFTDDGPYGPAVWDDVPSSGTLIRYGNGGDAGKTSISGNNNDGVDATIPGSGGGGGNAKKVSTDGSGDARFTGGDGADGIVKIAYKTSVRSFTLA